MSLSKDAAAFMSERIVQAQSEIKKQTVTEKALDAVNITASDMATANKDEALMQIKEGQRRFSEVFGYEPVTVDEDFPVTCYKAEDWNEAVRPFIPKPSGQHVWPEPELEALAIAIELGDNVWISGPTGSGKSTLIQEYCAAVGRPFIRFNGREDVESGPIFGQMSAREGTTEWHDGGYTVGFRYGALVLMDEATVIPSGIMMGLQWTLEPNGKLLLVDKPGSQKDQLVERDSRFRVVFGDNTKGLGDLTGAHAATNLMNTATLDRFGTSIELDYLNVNAEIDMLSGMFPKLDKTLCRNLVKFAGLVRTSHRQGELSLTVSPRALQNIAKKITFHGKLQQAVITSYINKLEDTDEQAAAKRHFSTAFDEGI